MWRLPQEGGVWARLDSLIADVTPLCQMCQTLPGAASMLIGWGAAGELGRGDSGR